MSVTRSTSTSNNVVHSYSQEEKEAFVDHVNDRLGDIQEVTDLLPLNFEDDSLFRNVSDGRLLCYLINDAVKDTVDIRAVNLKKDMNTFQKTENQNIVVNSAKAIGCTVVNIGPQDLIDGTEHLVLGLVWQIVRIGLMSQITLANHPELFRLLEDGEDISDLLKLPPEQILLRWMNYHLKNAGSNKRVNNFSGDIKDSEAYAIVLSQVAPDQCNTSPLQETDLTQRAEKTLQEADKIGCRKFVKPRDIVKGNPKLNLAFVAHLFNTCPGLEPLTEEEKAALEEWLFASEGTREARAFALWINSLGVDPFVNNLFEDLRDGLIILKVMDKIEPGSVDWKRVNQNLPLIKFKAVENANYAVDLATGKESGSPFKFSLVGVGGTDIVDGNKTLTLAVVWQLMRHHVLAILKSLSSDGKPVSEDTIIAWANQRVKSQKISGFKDQSLKTSVYFLELLDSIRQCVDWSLVVKEGSDEDYIQNAKYAISIARKLGACIFLLPEDIVEVKPKMILTFVGSIMAVSLEQN